MPKSETKKEKSLRIRKAAEKIRLDFSGSTFSSKEDVAAWMKDKSDSLEKQGFTLGESFEVLKMVQERMI